jgi:gliding motility-associated lipoprotein GldK
MKFKSLSKLLLTGLLFLGLSSCKSGDNGQLVGVQDRPTWNSNLQPYGMVYVPSGTFHTGPSDQDINYALIAKNRAVSIVGFYMDDAEITNNKYRQFHFWVRDSIAHKLIGGDHLTESEDGTSVINWDMPIDRSVESEDISAMQSMFYQGEDAVFGKNQINPDVLEYEYIWYDWRAAAAKDAKDQPRSAFVKRKSVAIAPDTMVWIKDFTYSYNEPMTRAYYSHPAYDDYPVVGVTWEQANAFNYWRTEYWNAYRKSNGEQPVEQFRLPSEHEWEYAARGGRQLAPYPWGGPYLRNTKGCILANFKPGRGNYPEDGGFYTVKVYSYWPNDYGLYNMAGNVAEWTLTAFNESSYAFMHDKNPDIRYDAKDEDPPAMKRKVVRGGSWKDVGYFLQTSTRHWEYQDSAKSYIGFRSILPFMGRSMNDFK